MRRYLSGVVVIAHLIILCNLISLMGCEGKEGPAGPAGTAGTAVCGTCHNVTTTVLAKVVQWEVSKHATGGSYIRGNSATCAPCHSSEGFRLKIAGETVTGIDNPTPPNCRTCHQIHTTYTEADYALATEAPVELKGIMYSGAIIDIGRGNLCANCHQTRERNYGLELGGADVQITSQRWGPHYGTQSNILAGSGGYEIVRSISYENSSHTNVVTDGCPTCHMAKASSNASGGHTFLPNTNGCNATGCHTDLQSFDYKGVQTEIEGLVASLGTLLLNSGIIDEEGHPISGKTVTADRAGALLNYLMVKDDGSKGVHNAQYSRALLQNSIESFQ